MVRVGGGWDTLENYLNKHDPCRKANASHSRRRSAAVISEHSDIPILALPNCHISPSVQKNSPNGKSMTLKTEEFPLTKPIEYDTNLNDAKLLITRDADGRHRIGQITFQTEEIPKTSSTCPQHQIPYAKQSSPSTDQDYSSLTEPTTSKPSSSSSFDLNDDPDDLLHLPQRPRIIESLIDSIDGFHRPTSTDFDLRDVRDALTTMDNDSLESSEGVLEVKKPPVNNNKTRRSAPLSINRFTSTPRSKSKSTKILDRDSGFDEQEFQRERLKSSSSVSSFGGRASISSDFRENRSFELRLQKLDRKKQMNKEQENLRTRRTKKSVH